MAKTNLQSYLSEVRNELSPDRKIPKITNEEIDFNTEMMSTDEEDAAKLFLAGIICRAELIKVLSGEGVLNSIISTGD